MKMSFDVLVTGGAGFIGSNLIEGILIAYPNATIYVFDNLSTGRPENLAKADCIKFTKLDLKSDISTWPIINNLQFIFHLAANADVRGGIQNRTIDLNENIIATVNLLEYARICKARHVVFASSAAVYGEPTVCPTPETYYPMQTSVYGASKLACESYIQAYTEYGDFKSSIFRFVSWLGPKYSHGVVYDFVRKLLIDSSELLVLGDGSQRKSFLDVRDGIRGVLTLLDHEEPCSIYNLGNTNTIDVTSLAKVVCDEMGLLGVTLKYSGGSRGWIGDSPVVHLNITRATEAGWLPKISIEESIRDTVTYLLCDKSRLFR